MKTNKIISLFLAGVITVGMFTACGDTKEESSAAASNPPQHYQPLEANALYKIASRHSGRVIESAQFGLLEGAYVQQGSYQGDLNQVWKAILWEDGTYGFENMSTNRMLSLKKESTGADIPLCVNTKSDSDLQKFKLGKTDEENVYKLIVNHSGLAAALEKESKSEGAKIVQEADRESPAQLWTFEKLDDGTRELPRLLPVAGDVAHSSTPEIVRFGDMYYAYIMAAGVSIKASKDMIHWETIGSAFPKDPTLPFEWMRKEVPAGSIWAPGVYEIDGVYYLYYCISTGGSQNSAIGVAANTTLDHTSPDFKWVDKGMVMRSTIGDAYNCIDPNIIINDDGQAWMVFGSWWSGIKMRKINNKTGMLDNSDTKTYDLAQRSPDITKDSIEAPFMIKRGEYYYLASARNPMGGTYHNQIGRSKSIFGPFVDKAGKSLMENGGTVISEPKDEIIDPGHASLFKDTDGQYYFVTEYFFKNQPSQLAISTIVWDDAGWPATALSPQIFPKK